jgi:hypothetical protein
MFPTASPNVLLSGLVTEYISYACAERLVAGGVNGAGGEEDVTNSLPWPFLPRIDVSYIVLMIHGLL